VSRDERLQRWLEVLATAPGMTSVPPAEAWATLVEDALAALPHLEAADSAVDVGSGSGSPGIPLAAARPDLRVTLLESSSRKCDFLRSVSALFPNVAVVCERAENHGRGAGRDAYAAALARALAPQAVAVEWCLPLVAPGGLLVLFAGRPEPGLDRVAAELGAAAPEVEAVAGSRTKTLLLFRKLRPTPERFPRRPGAARKRPLV
jgi:16S rRNA (guanine527-N7)-methyltransferase